MMPTSGQNVFIVNEVKCYHCNYMMYIVRDELL